MLTSTEKSWLPSAADCRGVQEAVSDTVVQGKTRPEKVNRHEKSHCLSALSPNRDLLQNTVSACYCQQKLQHTTLDLVLERLTHMMTVS